MEELIMAVLGLVLEVLGELLCWIPTDWISRQRDRNDRPSYSLWLLVGLILGVTSVLLFSTTFLHSTVLRIGNLVVAPMLAGFLASKMKGKSDRAGDIWVASQRFWCAFWLTLGIVLVRFVASVL